VRFIVPAIVLVCCCASSCDYPARASDPPPTFTRIVTLAPNLTELVFAIGAGDAIVGVSAYSDFPPQAKSLPLIGDAFTVDQEQLALLKPDLLLVWQSGTPAHIVEELRRVGYRVEVIRTRSLDDVAAALLRIGDLTGRTEQAERVVRQYKQDLKSLLRRRGRTADIRVFYQVSKRPLFTVNGEHYVSELIEMCGGSNVFAELNELAPAISVEAVIERDPEVMLASTDAGNEAFGEWDRWPRIAANWYGNRFLMPADEIGRATVRLVTAGRAVCDALDVARERRAAAARSPE